MAMAAIASGGKALVRSHMVSTQCRERVYACTRHNKHVGDASSTIIFWPLLKMREILPTVAERNRTLVADTSRALQTNRKKTYNYARE